VQYQWHYPLLTQAIAALSAPGKGTSITLGTGAIDHQQANPLHYKQTEETQKFEQVSVARVHPNACLGADQLFKACPD